MSTPSDASHASNAPSGPPRLRGRAAVGRADLARLMAVLPDREVARVAAVFGFERASEPESSRQDTAPGDIADTPRGATSATEGEIPTMGTATSSMPFWRLEEMQFTDLPAEQVAGERPNLGEPLNADDLENRGRSLLATPPAAPLTPWARLWPIVRAALQAKVPGRAPDVPVLLRAWSRGEVVRRVPRVTRAVWAQRASVWIDWSPRLVPFHVDQQEVYARIRAVCGKAGVTLRVLDSAVQAWSRVTRGDFLSGFRSDPDTPVLVLGDLGIYGGNADRKAWLRSARRLQAASVPVAALVPAPRDRWSRGATKEWNALAWERECRVNVPHSPTSRQDRAERLLRLISPATLVQPGLLRALRRLLPAHEADAGTEADVWQHADVLAADASGMVLRPKALVQWREAFAKEETATLQHAVAKTLGTFRRRHPKELLRIETLSWISLLPDDEVEPPGDAEDARGFAARLEASSRLDALSRRGAGGPLGLEAQRTAAAVRGCARTMLRSMPATAYKAVPALKAVWAAAFEGVSDVEVPEGVDPEVLRRDLPPMREPSWWAVRQVGNRLVLRPSPGSAWPSHEQGPGSPVSWMLVRDSHVYVRRDGEKNERQHTLEEGLSIPLRSGERLSLRADLSSIHLSCWRREKWAVAAGQDRFGLWAEADVKGVPLRFRWIPPGRFWMGSPEGEAGRFNDEGPRHQVTWTTGRWLAEVPVTQALWVAVMGKNPSRFVSPDRPVEQVSWDDCTKFVRKLNDLVPGMELDARLPSEAEWEHACRAGTETATWLGDLEILGENNAPLLDPIAWYGGNSGVEFELKNGYDMPDKIWKEKQYPHRKGGTHAVRRKLANPWGLHDMLGNGYEWCLDEVNPGDRHAKDDVVDPSPSTSGTDRVYRGGSWYSDARHVRAGYRSAYTPDGRNIFLGFRLARGQPPGPRSGADRGAGRAAVSPPSRDAARGAPKKNR